MTAIQDQARALLGHRVRVYAAHDAAKQRQPVIEGKVMAVAPYPSLFIVTDDGRQQDWMVTLPLDDLGAQAYDPPLPADAPPAEERAYARGLERAFREALDAIATAPGLPTHILLARITNTAETYGIKLDG